MAIDGSRELNHGFRKDLRDRVTLVTLDFQSSARRLWVGRHRDQPDNSASLFGAQRQPKASVGVPPCEERRILVLTDARGLPDNMLASPHCDHFTAAPSGKTVLSSRWSTAPQGWGKVHVRQNERKSRRFSSAWFTLSCWPAAAVRHRRLGVKDHPTVKAILTLVARRCGERDPSDVEKSLVGEVTGLLKTAPDFTRAGSLSGHDQQGRAGAGPVQARPYGRHPGEGDQCTRRARMRWSGIHAVTGNGSPWWGTTRSAAAGPTGRSRSSGAPAKFFSSRCTTARTGSSRPPSDSRCLPRTARLIFRSRPATSRLKPKQRPDPPLDPRLNHIVLTSQLVGDRSKTGRGARRKSPIPTDSDSDRPIVIK